jgi:hypothetical protein
MIYSALRWETDTRYYVAMLHRDLFGGLELLQMWGGKKSARSGGKKQLVAGPDEALVLVEKISKRRLAHGYKLVRRESILG